jgi:hypothetical protein
MAGWEVVVVVQDITTAEIDKCNGLYGSPVD